MQCFVLCFKAVTSQQYCQHFDVTHHIPKQTSISLLPETSEDTKNNETAEFKPVAQTQCLERWYYSHHFYEYYSMKWCVNCSVTLLVKAMSIYMQHWNFKMYPFICLHKSNIFIFIYLFRYFLLVLLHQDITACSSTRVSYYISSLASVLPGLETENYISVKKTDTVG